MHLAVYPYENSIFSIISKIQALYAEKNTKIQKKLDEVDSFKINLEKMVAAAKEASQTKAADIFQHLESIEQLSKASVTSYRNESEEDDITDKPAEYTKDMDMIKSYFALRLTAKNRKV